YETMLGKLPQRPHNQLRAATLRPCRPAFQRQRKHPSSTNVRLADQHDVDPLGCHTQLTELVTRPPNRCSKLRVVTHRNAPNQPEERERKGRVWRIPASSDAPHPAEQDRQDCLEGRRVASPLIMLAGLLLTAVAGTTPLHPV